MAGRLSRGLGVASFAALAGCAIGAQEARLPLPPEPVRVTSPVGAAMPVVESYSEVLVRTYIEDAQGQRRELGGAECRLEIGAYEARFRSPGRVLVPVPERNAPVLGVGCRAGAVEGTARRGLVRERLAGYPSWRPYGAWHRPWWHDPFYRRHSGAWLAAGPYDPYWDPGWRRGRIVGYPDVEVILR